MKKVILVALFAIAALILYPVSGMTSMTVTDDELEDITGQVGVSIGIMDLSLDIDIANIAYGDTDTGTIHIDSTPVGYTAGYVNIHGLEIDNLHVTMAHQIIGTDYYSNPLNIDVMTFASDAPFVALQGRTAIVIQMGDLLVQIQRLAIDQISLNSEPNTPETVFEPTLSRKVFTAYNENDSTSIGTF